MNDLNYYLSETQRIVQKSLELIERCNRKREEADERITISRQAALESFLILLNKVEGEDEPQSTPNKEAHASGDATLAGTKAE